jgi:chorismate mutase
MPNIEKNEIYKYLIGKSEKALKYGFDIQVIAYSYAIIEDRIEALLNYTGLVINPKDYMVTKLNKVRNNISKDKLGKYVSNDLLNKLETWIKERNKIFHSMARTKFEEEHVRRVAENGFNLVKKISEKSIKYKKSLRFK